MPDREEVRLEGPAPPVAPPEEEGRAAGEEVAAAAERVTLAAAAVRGVGWQERFVVPVLAVVVALAVGALVIVFTSEEPLREWAGFFRDPLEALRASGRVVADAYLALFRGALGSANALSETLLVAIPLVYTGLSVAFGFRAGLFNIGAEGQLTAGAILASAAGFSLTGLPGPLVVGAVVLAGFVGGALWGAVPGLLKAKTGAHEVITTIMLNFVAGFLALYLLQTAFFRRPDRLDPISKPVLEAFPRVFGTGVRLHAGFLVALLVAALVAWVLNRTTVGFEFQAVGANPDAARAAGMSPTRTFVVVMALAGGIAGMGAANQLLGVTPSLTPGFSSGFGFDGIAIALLGRARPAGVVAAALLFGILRNGSRSLQAATQIPVDIVTVITALVILFVAAPSLVRAIFRLRRGAGRPAGLGVGWGP
ncbi:MAG TPA: ABC transporter permease [Actinomycetota bacterium]|nr:ABC transporter permease [Actinomycetota bacterium]